VSAQHWSNINREWLAALGCKKSFEFLLRLAYLPQIYVTPEELRFFRNHLERRFYSRRTRKSGAEDFMPFDNCGQSTPHPIAFQLAFNQKAADDTRRAIWKGLLRKPNLSLLWRKAEAVGG
jgi:hypothetical protein